MRYKRKKPYNFIAKFKMLMYNKTEFPKIELCAKFYIEER